MSNRRLVHGVHPTRSTAIGQAMSTDAALELLKLARQRYGHDKVRLAVLVSPVAVEHVVDNAKDAAESIRRLKVSLDSPAEETR